MLFLYKMITIKCETPLSYEEVFKNTVDSFQDAQRLLKRHEDNWHEAANIISTLDDWEDWKEDILNEGAQWFINKFREENGGRKEVLIMMVEIAETEIINERENDSLSLPIVRKEKIESDFE